MGEYDLLIAISLILNVVFLFVFQKLNTIWSSPGVPNFFNQQILMALNRIKNPKIVHGVNSSRFVSLYIAGENQPIYPDPASKVNLPLQYESKNLLLGARGIPHTFAIEGELTNTNPLDNSNDDIQLAQAAASTLKFIDTEVERKHSKDSPFRKLNTFLVILGAVMVLGFIVIGSVLIGVQEQAAKAGQSIAKYSAIADQIIADPKSFGLPENIIGKDPKTPPPTNPFTDPLAVATPVGSG